jgi:Lrp/AsnC family transcriptional regulator, leucine-responsive regulatory protein
MDPPPVRSSVREVRGIHELATLPTVESTALDQIDRRIIAALQLNGRISWRELGDQVHLSATSVGERVRRLEREGVLAGYRALVDMTVLGKGFRAVVEVQLRPEVVPEDFEAALTSQSDVSFAAYVTGGFDYAMLLDCAGPEALDGFTRWCKAHGAARTESRVVLRRVLG